MSKCKYCGFEASRQSDDDCPDNPANKTADKIKTYRVVVAVDVEANSETEARAEMSYRLLYGTRGEPSYTEIVGVEFLES